MADPVPLSDPLPVVDDYYRDFALEARLVGDLPVQIIRPGYYPEHVLPDGTHLGDAGYHVYVYVAEGKAPLAKLRVRSPGSRFSVPLDVLLPDSIGPDRPDRFQENFATIAREVDAIREARDEFEREYARFVECARERSAWPRPMTRPQYEKIAKSVGADVLPDDEVSEWGAFSYPEYPVDFCVKKWVEQVYAFDLRRRRDEERARAEEEIIAVRSAAQSALAAYPVSRSYRKVFAGVPSQFLAEDGLHVVTSRKRVWIDGDSPSIWGSHLLGAEDSAGVLCEIEVRGTREDLRDLLEARADP